MLVKDIIFNLSIAALTSAAVVMKCNADYCLRALRASQFPTRLPQASADCSSYFEIQAVTYTNTVTSYSTTVSYSYTTITESFTATDTSLTTTDTTFTLDTGPTATVTLNRDFPVLKRDAHTIPSYASWCSGEVRYRSACSCIGASLPSITPSTTITVSTIVSVSVISTVEATTSVTSTDTVTKTVTDTETRTTGGGIATQTVGGFRVRIEYEDGGVRYLAYVYSTFQYFTRSVATLPEGTIFNSQLPNLAANTLDGVRIALTDTQANPSFLLVFPQSSASTRYPALRCNMNSARVLSCTTGNGWSQFVESTSDRAILVGSSPSSSYRRIRQFVVIPVGSV